MDITKIVDFIFEIPRYLKDLSQVLFDFLGEKMEINGIEYSVIGIFAGIGVVALIIYSIIKS